MPASTSAAECPHYSAVDVASAQTETCAECGSNFNLRLCITCGHVGCCESQQGHNTAHATASGHQIIKSYPMNDGHFTWCYGCDSYLDDVPIRQPVTNS